MSLKKKLDDAKSWALTKFQEIQEPKAGTASYEEKDESQYSRLGWIVLIVGFGGFMLWAMLAPLDKGVSAQGTVITDGQRKTIQAAVSGVIEDILVKDGDRVNAGQLLIKMNDLQLSAQAVGTLEQISGLKAQITGLESAIESLKSQLKFLQEQLVGLRQLAKEGYVAKNRVLEVERTHAQTSGQLAESQGNLERSRHQLAELEKRLPAMQFDLDNATIESPVDGSVINLAVFTKGAVVQPGTKLMEVSPSSPDLIVEAKVPVVLIDKVYLGLPVEMVFAAFNQRVTPRIPGEVSVVSADRTTDERTGEPYYKIQAKVTESGMRLLKDYQVRPGMPVEVFVITGERTMMNYLLRPLLDRMRSSLSEE